MPELPDVEGFRQVVLCHGTRARVVDVVVHSATIVRGVTVGGLVDGLRRRTIVDARRHGKWLTVVTDGPQLLLHFGMTGSLRWCEDVTWGSDDRIAVVLAHGALVVADRRNLGTVALVPTGSDQSTVTGPLGPDAGSITAAQLDGLLGSSRRGLKATLIDQEVIAGLGNMLTDEVLWRAGLDPARRAASLTSAERRDLYRSMRRTLRSAVAAGHIPRGRTWLSGQRAVEEPRCPRCSRDLAWRHLGGRSSLWCPTCQRSVDHPPPA